MCLANHLVITIKTLYGSCLWYHTRRVDLRGLCIIYKTRDRVLKTSFPGALTYSNVLIFVISLCVRGATVPHVCLLLYCDRNRIQWAWAIAGEWFDSTTAARVAVYATTISARKWWSGVFWYCTNRLLAWRMKITITHLYMHVSIWLVNYINVC